MNKIRNFLISFFFFLNSIFLYGDSTTSEIYLPDTASFKINKENPVFSLWIASRGADAENVSLEIPFLISDQNEKIPVSYSVSPETLTIFASGAGSLLTISLDSAAVSDLKAGLYSAVILINSDNADAVKKNINIEILSTGFSFSQIIEGVDWVWNNLLTLIWKIIEILLFLLFLYIIFRWFFRQFSPKKKPFRILPVVNETGDKGKYEGVASGIDDMLISHIQKITKLIEKSDEKNYRREKELVNRREGNLIRQEGKSQSFNITRSDFSMDFQKIGDLSIGPVKIPLGSIISMFSKMVRGGYLSGSLQQYGSGNKLILTLEEKPSFFSNSYLTVFETSWPSDWVKENDLAEGIPLIVEELSYKIVLTLSHIETDNWNALKHFLEGNLHYSNYEKNRSRLDLLRDAINCWRESLRHDPEFADAQYNLGVALDKENKIEDALFRYQRAIDFGNDEMRANAYLNSAVIYRDIKDLFEAQQKLDNVMKLNPELPAAHNLQGLIYLDQSSINYNEAEKYFKEAIRLDRIKNRRTEKKPNEIYFYNLSIAQYYLTNYNEAEKNALISYDLYEDNKRATGLLQTLGVIYLQKGFVYEKQKDFNSANAEFKKSAEYFNEALKNEPEKNYDILDGYAQALFYSGDKENALLYYKRLARVWPEYYRGYYGLSITIPQDNIFKIWLEKTEKILAEFPDINERVAKLENLLNNNLNEPAAVKLISAVLGGINYYSLLSYKTSAYYFDRSVNTYVENFILDAEVNNTYGLVMMALKDYENAVVYFQNAVNLYNEKQIYDLARCYENLAKAYSHLNILINDNYKKTWAAFENSINFYKKSELIFNASEMHVEKAGWLNDNRYYEAAEEECKKAILLNSNNLDVYHIKGNTLYNRRRYAEAIPQYEHSVELNYDTPGTHYTMGLCYLYLENYEEALRKFLTALKLDPRYGSPYDFKSPDAFQRIAQCYDKLGEYNKAVEILRSAVNLFPRMVKYNILLARALRKINKSEEAAQELCFALKDDENNTQNFKHLILNELSDIYCEYGANSDEAYKLIKQAVKICREKDRKIPQEEFCRIKNTLGWIYFHRKEYRKAALYLEKTLIHFLDDPGKHLRLALAYEKLSEMNSDLSLKAEYKYKAKDQWQKISTLPLSNGLSEIVKKHLNSN